MAEKESTSDTVLQVNSFIRGYHEYHEIWTPEIGDEYQLRRKTLRRLIKTPLQLSAKEKVGGLGENVSTRMN